MNRALSTVEEWPRNMTPIRKLLNRIRWDRAFGQADYLFGYLDRIENRIILVGLREVHFPQDAPDSFEVVDAEGQRHRVPIWLPCLWGIAALFVKRLCDTLLRAR